VVVDSTVQIRERKKMNTENVACEIVERILRELTGRGGFDGWYDNVGCEIQEEIENELVEITKRVLDENA